jgi:phage gp29-like protein
MNVFARAFRAAADAFSGKWIKRTIYDTRRLTLSSVTVDKITSALSDCQTGYMRQIADIYDMLPATDPHVLGVRRQLRAGVQGLEMEPVEISEDPLALCAVDECATAMDRPGSCWSDLVNGILEGYLRGASMVEVVWEDEVPGQVRYWKSFSLVPQQRLMYERNSGELMLITDPAKPLEGILVSKLPHGKFVRCQVDADIPDFSLRGTYRAILSDWYGRQNVSKWEQMAIERYGMPIPVGKYATEAGHQSLNAAMADFGAAGMLIVDESSSVDWGMNSFKELIHETYLEKSAERISIAFLGATQTVSIAQDAGSKASAGEHQDIRRDILFSIAELIGEAVRRDLFAAFLWHNRELFGAGIEKFAPRLRAQFDEPIDLKTTAEAWAILSEMLPIPESYARELTGIPAPNKGEDGQFEKILSAPAKPAPAFPPSAPPLQFPAPKAVAALRADGTLEIARVERVKVPIPETPPAFGKDIRDELKRLVNSGKTPDDIKNRITREPLPGFDKSADLLAAEMLDAQMKGILDARANRGAA